MFFLVLTLSVLSNLYQLYKQIPKTQFNIKDLGDF